jgi:3-hydroxyisobutyrate dehydrogenase-like beta-hydroxyacid dehydrogenase
MTLRKQVRLGLIGFGEVGSTLGQGFRNEGLKKIATYDKYAFGGPFSDLIQKRAAEAGVELTRSPEELAMRSDLLLGVTPGEASIESAEAFAPHLTNEHIFVDLASATPKVKQSMGHALRVISENVADASIMGTPHADGYQLPILTSGPAAEQFHNLMSPWGLKVEHVQGGLGAASGIKIIRSVVAKGLEALLVECVLGARRYGIDEAVLRSLGQFMDSRSFAEIANSLLITDVIHAERRSQEAHMCVAALEEAGVDPVMTRATEERLGWVARLGTKTHLGGIMPEHYSAAVETIEMLLKRQS